jgi:uncharacterized protein (TIGR03118 family)
MLHLYSARAAAAIGVIGTALVAVPVGSAQAFEANVTNLVSDGSVAAQTIDPNLINPWGIASSSNSPFWVSDNNSGFSTLYNTGGGKVPLTVAIPSWTGSGAGSPDGVVFNGSGGFDVSAGGKTGSSAFLFATEDGTIQGWSPSVNLGSTEIAVNNFPGAVYKGLAIASTGGSTFLYAANFRGGDVEMYNSSFGLVDSFTDPTVKKGYAPFNVQDLGGTLYVTYALQNAAKHDDVAGAGHGYVDAFSLNGTFERRIASLGGQIDSPWGLDIAPKSFGALAGDLLVGNFGDGTISVYNPLTSAYEGKLLGDNGKPIVEGDLWGLINGNGGAGGDPNTVYFTAGISDEAHGLFGALSAVPEPTTWTLMFIGLGLMGATLRGRRNAMAAA